MHTSLIESFQAEWTLKDALVNTEWMLQPSEDTITSPDFWYWYLHQMLSHRIQHYQKENCTYQSGILCILQKLKKPEKSSSWNNVSIFSSDKPASIKNFMYVPTHKVTPSTVSKASLTAYKSGSTCAYVTASWANTYRHKKQLRVPPSAGIKSFPINL